MTDTRELVEVVREAGQLGLDLLECERPMVGYYVAEADDGKPALEDDEQFWNAWIRQRDLLGEFGDIEVIEERDDGEVPYLFASSERSVSGEVFAQAHVTFGADGISVITLEFNIDGTWAASISERTHELTALDFSRRIAAIELAVLAHELESPAETLDYWMTNELYTRSQSSWATARQASRQTVSDRVRAAREKLDGE